MPRFAHIVVNLAAMILPQLRSTYPAKTVAISFAQLLPTACSSSRSSLLRTNLFGKMPKRKGNDMGPESLVTSSGNKEGLRWGAIGDRSLAVNA